MRIHDDDRAFLVSRMSDASVAALLNWTLARVQRSRAYLAEEAKAPLDLAGIKPEPADVGGDDGKRTDGAEAQAAGGTAVAASESTVPVDDLIGVAIPSAAPDPADLIGMPAQIDLEEAIAATPPAGLESAALAEWLVENSALTFPEIAARAGVELAQVEAIADGEPWPPAPPPHQVVPVANKVRAEKPGQDARKPEKAQTYRPTPQRPPTARNPGLATRPAEIPPSTLRYARWFRDARWRWETIAWLFDVPAGALQAALTR